MLDDDSELKHFAVVRNREQIEMIDLGKRPQPLLSKLKCGMETVVLRGRGLLWAQFGTV